MKNLKKSLAVFFALALTASVASAADIYVSLETGKNKNDGFLKLAILFTWLKVIILAK